MTSRHFFAATLLLALLTIGVGCGGDEQIKQQAQKAGVGEQTAGELSKMELTPEELNSIATAKQAGLDDVTLLSMVKSEHAQNLKFSLGDELALMTRSGFGPTTLNELVKMGAIPRMSDDLRALKDAKVADVAIVEIAKMRFREKKDLLSGYEYAQLKTVGLSDQGLLNFIRRGGKAQHLQTVQLQLALGKSEAEALKEAGL